jgi:Asp/Glu/hydantoin racemase
MTRIAFIHTVAFLADEFKRRMAAELPGTDCFHILNESLLQDLLRGEDIHAVYRRVVAQVLLATDAGAQTVVVTCSSTSPAVDIARSLTGADVLKIDDPMAAQAVRAGRRIGVLCTATSTVGPSTQLLRDHARAAGSEISIETQVDADAYAALLAGDRAQHDARVMASANALSRQVDVLVLAQASLAHLQPRLEEQLACPVLASPALLMQELQRRIRPAPQPD